MTTKIEYNDLSDEIKSFLSDTGGLGELNSTDNTGVITGSTRCRWLVDTTTTRNRTIGADVRDLLVKDITGKAGTNNVTITAPSGKTINGAATETIDVNYGWVQYVLVGTDFKTIGGK